MNAATPAPRGQTPAERAALQRRLANIVLVGSIGLLTAAVVLFLVGIPVAAYCALGVGLLDLALSTFFRFRAQAADREANSAGPVIQEL